MQRIANPSAVVIRSLGSTPRLSAMSNTITTKKEHVPTWQMQSSLPIESRELGVSVM